MRHLPMPPKLRGNIEYRCYQSGHMALCFARRLSGCTTTFRGLHRSDREPAAAWHWRGRGRETWGDRVRVRAMKFLAKIRSARHKLSSCRSCSPAIRTATFPDHSCLSRPTARAICSLLGDLDCPAPFQLSPLRYGTPAGGSNGSSGDHDCETETAYDNLVADHSGRRSGFRVSELGGLSVAGLPASSSRPLVPATGRRNRRIDPPVT